MQQKTTSWGGTRPGAGRPKASIRIPIGRARATELSEPVRLHPDLPNDTSDIVLARNDEGRMGMYIEEIWYGAGECLTLLDFLQPFRPMLEAMALENIAWEKVQRETESR